MHRSRRTAIAAAAAVLAASGIDLTAAAAATRTTVAPVVAFQAAGAVGGGVLVPGTTYPPTRQKIGVLRRGRDWVRADIRTSGLPPGAYTVWWVIFDNPAACTGPCGEDDLLAPEPRVSVLWATGGVVGPHGFGNFRATYRAGDDLGQPGRQHILGDGSLDPARAEIHNIIKYHGPASPDPAVLHEQTTTLMGACDHGANAVDLGPPFGVQCFDPQAVVHPRP